VYPIYAGDGGDVRPQPRAFGAAARALRRSAGTLGSSSSVSLISRIPLCTQAGSDIHVSGVE
jgi:hypothetical protein